MWTSLKRLGRLLSPKQRLRAVALMVLLVGNALLELVGVGLVPVYIGVLAQPERLLQDTRVIEAMALLGIGQDQLTPRLLLYGGTALLFAVFTAKLIYVPLLAYVRARYIQGVVRSQATRLLNAYLRAPYEFHLRRNSAELMRNVNAECLRLGETVLNPLVNMASQFLITLGITVLLVVTMPGAALFALLVIAIVSVPVVAVLTRRIKRLANRAQGGRKRVIRFVQEGLGGVKEVKLLGRERYFVQRFARSLQQVLHLQRFLQVQSVGLPVFMEWVSVTALLTLVIVLFQSNLSQEAVLAVIALFAVAMARLKGSITGLLGAYAQARSSLVSVDVIDGDLRQLEQASSPAPVPAQPRPARRLAFNDQIHLDDVWFHYAGSSEYALRGIDLTITKGEAIGFVGPSGSGKSTVVDLILGILEPNRGRISVDGADIRQDAAAWHRMVGYIPQAIFLMDGTVRQNIALGLEDREIDSAAVDRAVVASHLDEFIGTLPDGLDTTIGERGVRLSGGQRQRIAIARALYHEPAVLVMDEATSALDNLTEKAVMEAVDGLKGERTILMIAHRLTTVKNCDRIVFLQAGSIEAIGRYADLVDAHQEFKRLAQAR